MLDELLWARGSLAAHGERSAPQLCLRCIGGRPGRVTKDGSRGAVADVVPATSAVIGATSESQPTYAAHGLASARVVRRDEAVDGSD